MDNPYKPQANFPVDKTSPEKDFMEGFTLDAG
jgi:hypothetical protein